MTEEPRLPAGWARVVLGEVFKWSSGGTPRSTERRFYQGDVPWAIIGDLTDGDVWDTKSRITTEGLENSSAKWVEPGSLLMAMYGSIGKLGIARSRLTTNQAIVFTNPDPVLVEFLFWYLYWKRSELHALGKGGTQKNISQEVIKAFPFLLAPLGEQRRIVAKIEELFSGLDAGVAALARAKANLVRYRAAVLKAAVEGKLTAEWRKKHPYVEPASKLLDRILSERRKKWEEAELAKYAAGGRTPPKNWQDNYEEPAPPDTKDLPELPKGWCWATLQQLGFLDRGRSRHRPRNAPHLFGGPYPFIQTGEVSQANTYIKGYATTYSEAGLAQSRLWRKGTLCITIAANIAKTAILTFDACFPDSVVGFTASPENVSIRYVDIFLRTAQRRLEALAPATAQRNINLDTLFGVPIPLPRYVEQEQIVREVDERLSIVEQVGQYADSQLHRAGRLRLGILKRAFEGRLVPQDSKDEPASRLLERLKTERETARPEKPRTQPRKSAARDTV